MKYILSPDIEYDTEIKDLRTRLLSDESREYLIKLLNLHPNLDLPETVNLQAFLHTIDGDETKESNATCQMEKEILDNLTFFQEKQTEKNQRFSLEMSLKHHNAEKKKLLERYQQTKNKYNKQRNWTFSVLITSSLLLFGAAILGLLAPAFAGSFIIGGGWLLIILAIPNAALINICYLTSHKLDELQAEIYKTAGILDSINLKLASYETHRYSKIQQIPDNNSISLLQSKTSETSPIETSTSRMGFVNLLTTATIHQIPETNESLTKLLDQSGAQKAESYSPNP